MAIAYSELEDPLRRAALPQYGAEFSQQLVGLAGRHEPIECKLLGGSETAGNSNISPFVSRLLVSTEVRHVRTS
jgi:hypothetical protein